MAIVKIVPALEDNYIAFIVCESSKVFYCVDPGDARAVARFLSQNSELSCASIFCTHHHNDHIDGVASLAAATRAPVYGPRHPKLEGLLTHPLGDGDKLSLACGAQIEALETPGHTVPALSYVLYRPGECSYLFSGDTLFGAGCGRLFEGQPAQMWASLVKLRALPPSTQMICGHEYTEKNLLFAESLGWRSDEIALALDEVQKLRAADKPTLPRSLALERETNPFLNADDPELAVALGLAAEVSATEVFAVLRERRNRY